MSLRTKTAIIIGTALTALILVLYVVLSQTLMVGFQHSETISATQNIDRVVEAILNDQANMDRIAVDWAVWDETYQFIRDRNQEFIDTNLVPNSVKPLNVDLMLFFSADRSLVYSFEYDWTTDQRHAAPQALVDLLQAHPEALVSQPVMRAQSGLVNFDGKPLMLALRPITDNSGEAEADGILVIGHYLTDGALESLVNLTRLNFELVPIADAQQQPLSQEALPTLTAGSSVAFRPQDDATLLGYRLYRDLFGQPTFVVKVALLRTDYQEGQLAVRSLMLALALIGLAFVLITIFLSDRLITSRMVKISRQVASIGKKGDLGGRVIGDSADEIGQLSGSINTMLDALAESRAREAENEERYRLMIRQAREGFALIDTESGEILDANQAFRTLTGYCTEEDGQASQDDYPEVCKDLFTLLQDTHREEQFELKTLSFTRADGVAVDTEVSSDVIRFRDRSVFFVFLRDITERKRMEAERQQLLLDTFDKAQENARLFLDGQKELEHRLEVEARLAKREHSLAGLVEFQNILLASLAESTDLQPVLEGFANIAGAERVTLYLNETNLQGDPVANLAEVWTTARSAPAELHESVPLKMLVYRDQLPHYHMLLNHGQTVCDSVEDMPEPEKTVLAAPGMVGIGFIPIRVHDQIFAIVGFEDWTQQNRAWDEAELDILRSAGSALSLAYERQAAEESSRLRASELQAVFNALPETYLHIDRDGRILDSHLVGGTQADQESVIGRRIHDMYPADVAQQIYEGVQMATREGKPVAIEYSQPGENGLHVFDARLSPIPGGQVVALVRDITDRKLTEQALRKSEESIRSLYNITSSQQLNFSEKIQALLRVGCQHFGMENGILGHMSGDHFEVMEATSSTGHASPGSVYPVALTFCRDTLQAGGPVAIEHMTGTEWETHLGHTLRNVEAYLGTPLIVAGTVFGTLGFSSQAPHQWLFTNADKEFLRLMAQWIGSEIDREQSTQQLQRYAQEIARKNQALAEARDEALTASKQKSEFLATMSHEIRTPMNAIIGMTDLLLETMMSSEQRDYTTIVRDSAEVLLNLLNDILDFSKIEAGKVELEAIEFESQNLVERAAELFISRVREKGLELLTFVAPDVPAKLLGDPMRLTQILFNLVSNAVKFTPEGEIAIQVGMVHRGEKDCTLRFSVTDSGIGLSEAAKGRLFQPFTQADGSTSRRFGGTGLGLAISKSLTELMGGEIGVESKEGAGSTFHFTARFNYLPGTSGEAPQTRVPEARGARGLVIDKSTRNRQFLREYLAATGLTAEAVGTGEEALEAITTAQAQGQPYRVVLIELNLADIDAYSFVRSVQSRAELTAPRFGLITSLDERGQADQALQSGFTGFLMKPIRRWQLVDMVRQMLSAAEPVPLDVEVHLPEGSGGAIEGQITPAQAAALPPILLAEDNMANQKLAMIQLKKLGYRVVAVADGKEVLDAVLKTNQKFSLLLLDCQMPEVDGFSASRIIRKAELTTGRHIPIVAMTANAMQGDREVCLASGMDDYVSKPVNIKDLREVLERWLGDAVVPGEIPAIRPIAPEPAGSSEPTSATNAALIELQPAVDPAALAEIRALETGGEDFLGPLIDTYLRESIELIAKLKEMVPEGNAEEIRRQAHKIKGSAANLGARCLADLCLQMETACREGRLEDTAGLAEQIEREFGRVTSSLLEERGKKMVEEKA
jgi:PAS domain S-box-containing protein